MHKKAFTTIFIIPGIIALLAGLLLSMREGAALTLPTTVPTEIVNLKDDAVFNLENSYVTRDIDGIKQTMMAYNRSIPGPEIHVKQGDTITIHFTNNIDMETLLHAHGVRMENAYDGTHLVQDMMKPGKSFDYKLTFPDPGVFIYHPHTNRDDLQQDLGLYGSIIVEPKDPNYWPPVNREQNIVLDDVLLEDGTIAPHSPAYTTHALMGRYGNTMFVNGETNLHLTATQGEVVRYYLTNTANSRPFAFTMPGLRMKLVGGDSGRYERETFTDRIVLGPSERAIVDVYYEFPKSYMMMTDPGNGEVTHMLASIDVKEGAATPSYVKEFQTLRSGDAYSQSLSQFRSYLDEKPTKSIVLTLDVDMNKIMGEMGGMSTMGSMHSHATTNTGSMAGMNMGSGNGMAGMNMMGQQNVPIEWEDTMGAMNVFSTDKTTHWIIRDMTDTDASTSTPKVLPKDNTDIHWVFNEGDLVKIRIYNDPKSMHPMQHPFHIHGQHFLVLATNGVANDNLVWKDTTLIKTGDTVDILVPMENIGKWMAHCHSLEHLAAGMVMLFDVLPKP